MLKHGNRLLKIRLLKKVILLHVKRRRCKGILLWFES
jgi:hypothetical protein